MNNNIIDGLSMDLEQNAQERLRAVFPDCFSEGKLDIGKLLNLCGEYIDNDFEKYKFEWNDKTISTSTPVSVWQAFCSVAGAVMMSSRRLANIMIHRGCPEYLRSDNGSEFVAKNPGERLLREFQRLDAG